MQVWLRWAMYIGCNPEGLPVVHQFDGTQSLARTTTRWISMVAFRQIQEEPKGPIGVLRSLVPSPRRLGLVQVTLRVSGWASRSICWMCGATQEGDNDYRQFGLKTAWRRHRHTPRQFFTLLMAQGFQASPLFSCPFFALHMVCVDLLHTLDLGVTQDCLGCLFWYACQTFFPGNNHATKVLNLWNAIKAH